ncbi:MAG: phosphate regulon transcriptional regulator PhoB [Gammaproteobacteria bacterium]
MSSPKILVVDDEAAIRTMLAFNLRRAGFEVCEAHDGATARDLIANERPDLVLMDWMLPDISGLEMTRTLKRAEEFQALPIIMLTARTLEQDKINGLDSGADDYITKPFSPRELISRVNAVLRRTRTNMDDAVVAGELSIDVNGHRVMAGDEEIKLGPTEYRLLKYLMTNSERVYSRSQLLDRVWGANVYLEERTVDVHIRRLRKTLATKGYDVFIQTVRGVGYRFSTKVA